jgi:hypothetical protein
MGVAFTNSASWPSYSYDPAVKELKNFSKKFEKPLDKPHGMWYNINVKRAVETTIQAPP